MQVAKILIIALLIVYLVIPLAAFAGLTGFSQVLLGHYSDKIFDAWQGSPTVATSFSRSDINRMEDQLNVISAYEGESRSAANQLQIVLVDFDFGAASRHRRPLKASKAGFQAVTLDIASVRNTASVVISGQPVEWKLLTNPEKPRATLALEGSAPVAVSGGYKGVLAGYRVAAFGDWRTTRPDHYISRHGNKEFCHSLKVWRRHFGIRRKDVYISVVRNPTRVSISDRDVYHDGQLINNLPAINRFCRRW